jgi:hypothetical protein
VRNVFFSLSLLQSAIRVLGTLRADVLAGYRGKVPSTEEISLVNSITVD